MHRSRRSPHGLSLLSCAVLSLTLSACGGEAPTSSSPAQRSDLVPPVQQQDVVFPLPPAVDFCGGGSASQIREVSTEAGLAWSSSIFVPATGGSVSVYFANLGPGPISFVNPAWSSNGNAIPLGTSTDIAMTPTGSSLTFNDGYWGGTFGEGFAAFGCVGVSGIEFKSPKHKHATAHVDLSFIRDGVTHTVRVNIHTGTVAS